MPMRSIKFVLSALVLCGCGAMLVACQPAKEPETAARTGPVASREDVVPLVRPLSLTSMAEPLIVEFELPPPGPNSNTTLTLGLRVFGADDAASAAVATTLTDSNLRAELKLVRLGVGNEVPIPLTRREYRGHDASQIVPVGADGRVPQVVRTSIDTTAVEEAGIPSRASSSRVLAFAWAPDAVPGTYRLELKLIAPDPKLAAIESELLLAYQHRSK
ncbi:hypothetical protein EDF77_2875 [Stenotrophomonas maltophilia]|nr:hypothetical protein EDF77_2875 [Stenotrophomonas maltophilia]